jgi:peptidoglycan/xylan/chitin deacetylase (PgdA/CDA1 family)
MVPSLAPLPEACDTTTPAVGHDRLVPARSSLARSVKHLAAAVDRVRPVRPGLVVLVYHRFGGTSASEIDIDPAVFADQIAEIRHRVVPLGRAIELLEEPSTSEPPVVITIDDGSADVVEHAVPVLADAGVSATLYLTTAFVDGVGEVPDGGRPVSWAALADAVAAGALEVGSHTHSHALFDRIDAHAARTELDTSIGLIEDHLGARPLDFAYPKAVLPTEANEREVRARFRSAAIAGTRANPFARTDPMRLHRSPIQVGDGMRWFRAKVAGGMAAEDLLRRGLNRIRYASADR